VYGATIEVGVARVVVVSAGASLDPTSVVGVSDVVPDDPPPQAVRDRRDTRAMMERRMHQK